LRKFSTRTARRRGKLFERLSFLPVIFAAAALTVSGIGFDLVALVAASVCGTRCGGTSKAA